ncbi:oligopeptide ABC transporter substrate-binding protein [Aerococcaceae bacterium DSM 111020]|nr:oligopeptide ABC transporter substrate-binding protein [Aerococcaceae bacterium DSM 111020]
MNKRLKKMFITSSALAIFAATANPLFVQAQETNEDGIVEFESQVTHDGEAIEGGTLRYALNSDSNFEGLLNNMFYSSAYDASVIGLFAESLYGYDENYVIDNSGFADVEFDQEGKSVTITIPEGVKWHDGEDVTIDDAIFPYYVIGHPDYTGVRYSEDFMNVVGMEEYHAGEAEEISGLDRIDDYTLKINYKNFPNSMLQAGGGVGSYIEPEHVFEGIEVKDMENSDPVRKNPIGFGAFKVEQITPGEAVTYTRFDDYYKGQPKIEKIELEVVNPSTIVTEMNNGNYDIASLPADQFDTFADASNYTVLGVPDNAYTYIGFKMGTWNDEEGKVNYDPERVVSNKALRQAMAYAVDNNAVAVEFYDGTRSAANSLIPEMFTEYHNADQEGFTYDPERAKQILADAGFEDTDNDGFVEDPNGEKLQLNFASMAGGETAEPLALYYIQMWNEVGLDVKLVDDQLLEFNSFYERIQTDDPAIDVYQAAWVTGGDPNPTGLYGPKSNFNYTRWETEDHNAILEKLNSDDAFDPDFKDEAFKEWQAYMHEEAPVFPTLFRNALTGVNQRVKTYDIQHGNDLGLHELELTADAPIK